MVGKDKSPLERVAQEMSTECELNEDELVEALTGLLDHLRRRAADKIAERNSGAEALRFAREYWAASALLQHFGTTLIAFDDIDGELPDAREKSELN